MQGEPEGAHRDHHGVAGADLGVLLGPVGGADVDGADQFVGRERVAFHAGVEVVDGDAPGAPYGGGLDLGARGEQRGVGVAGRGGGAEVAADAAAVADLRGGDRAGGEGEARQRGAQPLHDRRVRHAGAEAYGLRAGLPLVQLAEAGEIEEAFGAAAAEVEVHHHVGAAGQRYGVGVLGLGGERLVPVGGAQEFHTGSLFDSSQAGSGGSGRGRCAVRVGAASTAPHGGRGQSRKTRRSSLATTIIL